MLDLEVKVYLNAKIDLSIYGNPARDYNVCPHFKGNLLRKNCNPLQICHFIDIFVALANAIDFTLSQISIKRVVKELFKPTDTNSHFSNYCYVCYSKSF